MSLRLDTRGGKALIVQVVVGRQSKSEAAESLAELERLADTAGFICAGSITQRREKPDAAFFAGQGKLAEIQLACRSSGAEVLIFDNPLTSVQVSNLGRSLGVKVIDRTELILLIFARRAKSSEAQAQVELAQMQFMASRVQIAEKQQRFFGGIGARGPGESPFQLHKAALSRRIRMLKAKLDDIRKRRSRTRKRRLLPVVCLVGYTNAGKSTLLNALSAADAYVDDRLFATLDTKSRMVYLPGARKAIITDTVGFIRNLPHGLIASFRSTLDEISEAEALLLVADAGNQAVAGQLDVVRDTLAEIEAGSVPAFVVFNKIDCPQARAALPGLKAAYPEAMFVSALTGEGLDGVRSAVADIVRDWRPG